MSKAQVAMEHLLIIGVGLLIIIPTVAILYNYSMGQSDQIISSRIQAIGNSIVDQSESVFYEGPPSKRVLKVTFPDSINSIDIIGHKELSFSFGGNNNSLIFVSHVPITGPFFRDTSTLCNDSSARGACYTKGLKNVIIYATDTNSTIIIK